MLTAVDNFFASVSVLGRRFAVVLVVVVGLVAGLMVVVMGKSVLPSFGETNIWTSDNWKTSAKLHKVSVPNGVAPGQKNASRGGFDVVMLRPGIGVSNLKSPFQSKLAWNNVSAADRWTDQQFSQILNNTEQMLRRIEETPQGRALMSYYRDAQPLGARVGEPNLWVNRDPGASNAMSPIHLVINMLGQSGGFSTGALSQSSAVSGFGSDGFIEMPTGTALQLLDSDGSPRPVYVDQLFAQMLTIGADQLSGSLSGDEVRVPFREFTADGPPPRPKTVRFKLPLNPAPAESVTSVGNPTDLWYLHKQWVDSGRPDYPVLQNPYRIRSTNIAAAYVKQNPAAASEVTARRELLNANPSEYAIEVSLKIKPRAGAFPGTYSSGVADAPKAVSIVQVNGPEVAPIDPLMSDSPDASKLVAKDISDLKSEASDGVYGVVDFSKKLVRNRDRTSIYPPGTTVSPGAGPWSGPGTAPGSSTLVPFEDGQVRPSWVDPRTPEQLAAASFDPYQSLSDFDFGVGGSSVGVPGVPRPASSTASGDYEAMVESDLPAINALGDGTSSTSGLPERYLDRFDYPPSGDSGLPQPSDQVQKETGGERPKAKLLTEKPNRLYTSQNLKYFQQRIQANKREFFGGTDFYAVQIRPGLWVSNRADIALIVPGVKGRDYSRSRVLSDGEFAEVLNRFQMLVSRMETTPAGLAVLEGIKDLTPMNEDGRGLTFDYVSPNGPAHNLKADDVKVVLTIGLDQRAPTETFITRPVGVTAFDGNKSIVQISNQETSLSMADDGSNQALLPTDTILLHELTHAVHSLAGAEASASADSVSVFVPQAKDPLLGGENSENYFKTTTIDPEEVLTTGGPQDTAEISAQVTSRLGLKKPYGLKTNPYLFKSLDAAADALRANPRNRALQDIVRARINLAAANPTEYAYSTQRNYKPRQRYIPFTYAAPNKKAVRIDERYKFKDSVLRDSDGAVRIFPDTSSSSYKYFLSPDSSGSDNPYLDVLDGIRRKVDAAGYAAAGKVLKDAPVDISAVGCAGVNFSCDPVLVDDPSGAKKLQADANSARDSGGDKRTAVSDFVGLVRSEDTASKDLALRVAQDLTAGYAERTAALSKNADVDGTFSDTLPKVSVGSGVSAQGDLWVPLGGDKFGSFKDSVPNRFGVSSDAKAPKSAATKAANAADHFFNVASLIPAVVAAAKGGTDAWSMSVQVGGLVPILGPILGIAYSASGKVIDPVGIAFNSAGLVATVLGIMGVPVIGEVVGFFVSMAVLGLSIYSLVNAILNHTENPTDIVATPDQTFVDDPTYAWQQLSKSYYESLANKQDTIKTKFHEILAKTADDLWDNAVYDAQTKQSLVDLAAAMTGGSPTEIADAKKNIRSDAFAQQEDITKAVDRLSADAWDSMLHSLNTGPTYTQARDEFFKATFEENSWSKFYTDMWVNWCTNTSYNDHASNDQCVAMHRHAGRFDNADSIKDDFYHEYFERRYQSIDWKSKFDKILVSKDTEDADGLSTYNGAYLKCKSSTWIGGGPDLCMSAWDVSSPNYRFTVKGYNGNNRVSDPFHDENHADYQHVNAAFPNPGFKSMDWTKASALKDTDSSTVAIDLPWSITNIGTTVLDRNGVGSYVPESVASKAIGGSGPAGKPVTVMVGRYAQDPESRVACSTTVTGFGYWNCDPADSLSAGSATLWLKNGVGVGDVSSTVVVGGSPLRVTMGPIAGEVVPGAQRADNNIVYGGEGAAGHRIKVILTPVSGGPDSVGEATVDAHGVWRTSLAIQRNTGYRVKVMDESAVGAVLIGTFMSSDQPLVAQKVTISAVTPLDAEGTIDPAVNGASRHLIVGNAAPFAQITVTDKDNNVLCVASADSAGAWSCEGAGNTEIVTAEPTGVSGEVPTSLKDSTTVQVLPRAAGVLSQAQINSGGRIEYRNKNQAARLGQEGTKGPLTYQITVPTAGWYNLFTQSSATGVAGRSDSSARLQVKISAAAKAAGQTPHIVEKKNSVRIQVPAPAEAGEGAGLKDQTTSVEVPLQTNVKDLHWIGLKDKVWLPEGASTLEVSAQVKDAQILVDRMELVPARNVSVPQQNPPSSSSGVPTGAPSSGRVADRIDYVYRLSVSQNTYTVGDTLTYQATVINRSKLFMSGVKISLPPGAFNGKGALPIFTDCQVLTSKGQLVGVADGAQDNGTATIPPNGGSMTCLARYTVVAGDLSIPGGLVMTPNLSYQATAGAAAPPLNGGTDAVNTVSKSVTIPVADAVSSDGESPWADNDGVATRSRFNNGVRLEFKVQVPKAGLYSLDALLSNGDTVDRSIYYSANGSYSTRSTVNPTGSWTTFGSNTLGTVLLKAGENTVTLASGDNENGPDVRSITLTKIAVSASLSPTVIPVTKATSNDGDPLWFDNDGVGTRSRFNNGVQLSFPIEVPSSGTYSLSALLANGDSVARPVYYSTNGGYQVKSMIAPTGSWTSFKQTELGTVQLRAGVNTITLSVENNENGPDVRSVSSLRISNLGPSQDTVSVYASPDTYQAGDTVTFYFSYTNRRTTSVRVKMDLPEGRFTGHGTPLSPHCTISDGRSDVSATFGSEITMASQASLTCVAEYQVVDDDVTAGNIAANPSITVTPPASNTPTDTPGRPLPPASPEPTDSPTPTNSPTPSNPSVGSSPLTKGGSSMYALRMTVDKTEFSAGDTLTYQIVLTNTSNNVLNNAGIKIPNQGFNGQSPLPTIQSCSLVTSTGAAATTNNATSLQPGDQLVCIATYLASKEDVTTGAVSLYPIATFDLSKAPASAPPTASPLPSDATGIQHITWRWNGGDWSSQTGSIPTGMLSTYFDSGLYVSGRSTTVTHAVTNTSAFTLKDVQWVVSDPNLISSCSGEAESISNNNATLLPGQTMTCQVRLPQNWNPDNPKMQWSPSQPVFRDLMIGQILQPAKPSASVHVNDNTNSSDGDLHYRMDVKQDQSTIQAGDKINYTFTVWNESDKVTLNQVGIQVPRASFTGSGTPPTITDCYVSPDRGTATHVDNGAADIPPLGRLDCNASYTVTQADVTERHELILTPSVIFQGR